MLALFTLANAGALVNPTFIGSHTPSRCAAHRCADVSLNEDAAAAIPPGQLADAWQRDEKVRSCARIYYVFNYWILYSFILCEVLWWYLFCVC